MYVCYADWYIGSVSQMKSRLGWFGQVEHKGDSEWTNVVQRWK